MSAITIVIRSTSNDSLIWWVWQRLRRYRASVALLSLLSTLEVLLRVASPWPMKAIVDHVLGSTPMAPGILATLAPLQRIVWFVGDERARLLTAIVVVGLLVQAAHQLVMMLHSRLSAAAGHRMVRDLREELFAHMQALSLAHHDRTPTGDSMYRLETDAVCIEHLLLRGLFPIVFSALTLVVMFAILAGIDFQLAIVSATVVPLLYGWLRRSTRRMQPAAREAKALEAGMVQQLHESLSSIRVVKTYAREDFEEQRFADAAGRALAARMISSHQEATFGTVVSGLTIAGSSLVMLIGGLAVLSGRISLGTLLLVTAYLGFVYGPLCGIANTTGSLQHAAASARRIRETLALSPEVADLPDAIDAAVVRGHVSFEGVSFGYASGPPVLRDVTFTTMPGETVALVGRSGAGKSTAVSLIARLYEPGAGRILIDGLDSRRYTRRSLRRRIAFVLQETRVLAGTVRDNLRYGRLDASDDEVIDAARAACAHEFIMALPEGYDTALGEGGCGLSGGQKQRIAIARAFLKDAPILILDEPTAALDSLSERLVFEGLRSLQAGRTTFVIAHRLSTVRAAHRILVLDNGTIVAEGRHEELLETCSLYRTLAAELTTPIPAIGDGCPVTPQAA